MAEFKTGSDKPTRYAVTESGQVKEKASPELLPTYLRNLPSELVTKEIEVEEKVHAEDPPHIIGAIVSDYAKAERGEDGVLESLKTPKAPDVPEDMDVRLTQYNVDVRRLCVMRAWAQTQKDRIARRADGKPADMTVKYLWFPEDDHRNYVMRHGNPPADRDRPKHLRGLRLEIDIANATVPETIIDKLKEKGVEVEQPYVSMVRDAMNPNRILTADGEVWR